MWSNLNGACEIVELLDEESLEPYPHLLLEGSVDRPCMPTWVVISVPLNLLLELEEFIEALHGLEASIGYRFTECPVIGLVHESHREALLTVSELILEPGERIGLEVKWSFYIGLCTW